MRKFLPSVKNRRLLLQKWWVLLAVPAINTVLIVIFWQSQLIQYLHQTTGILFMWLVSGLLFVLVQLSLQWEAWRNAKKDVAAEKLFEIRWGLGVQIGLFILIAVYNTIALIELLLVGVLPTKLFDIFIALLLLATLLFIFYKYRNFKTPAARLVLATGTKAAPQVLQAGAFIVLGSLGMHPATILAIAAMGLFRYLLARHSRLQYPTEATKAADKAAFRDFISILLMCAGWIIGRF